VTFGSLFAGIGGLDLGLERAGMQCKWQVEIDDYCQRVLAKHWPDVERFRDVREVGSHNLKPVDLICGGDPCQENSGARRHPTTSPSLGDQFIRVVAECRPRLVLRENPSGVRSDAPWPWWRFRAELERLGYAVLPFRLRACCVGLDHRRDRLFLLADRSDSMCARLEGEIKPRINPVSAGGPVRRIRLSESDVVRAGHGIPDYMERIRGVGNAVAVPVAEYIGRLILGGAK